MPCFELESMQTRPLFDTAAFAELLDDKRLGRTLLSAAQLPSTQTLLQTNARLFPDGTVCVADVQSGGKGVFIGLRCSPQWFAPCDMMLWLLCY